MKTQNIVGQETLVKEISRIFEIFKASESEVRPHSILTGSSGSGKTFLIKEIAKSLELAFIEINAAQLTKEGTSGNSLSKALSPLLQLGPRQAICFVDEFDKLFISGNSNDSSAHESTTGVQNEFLKVLESDTVSVFGDYGKYINVPAKNVLFIFAGAFNNEDNITLDRLREIGVKTEFLGRVGLVYNTNPLTLENLLEILENSSLLANYLALFQDIDKEKTVYELKQHITDNFATNTLGARMVNTLIHQYFIKGGNLGKQEAKAISFQNTLSWKESD